jgi:hypothetical protein
MTSNAIAAPNDRSYPKAREISTSKTDGQFDPSFFSDYVRHFQRADRV